jgi:hypothetical protein
VLQGFNHVSLHIILLNFRTLEFLIVEIIIRDVVFIFIKECFHRFRESVMDQLVCCEKTEAGAVMPGDFFHDDPLTPIPLMALDQTTLGIKLILNLTRKRPIRIKGDGFDIVVADIIFEKNFRL